MSAGRSGDLVERQIWIPQRICLKAKSLHEAGSTSFQDWAFYAHHVYIGRHNKFTGAMASKWQNPYKLQDYSRSDSLLLFEWKVRSDSFLMNSLPELEAKTLGCYCYLTLPCHGQILIKLFKEKYAIPDIVPNGSRFQVRLGLRAKERWVNQNHFEKRRLMAIIRSRYRSNTQN